MKLANYKLITLSLVGFTACSGLVLASTKSYADNDSATDEVNITVPVACTMTGTIATGQEHTATLQPGTYSGASGSAYENGIGKTTLATFCNDYNGFSIYAIGFTDDTEGNNTLLGTSASGGATIPTKVYESADTTSNWSMKVTKVTDSSATFNPANMTISNSFDSWHTVPDDYTRVAEYHASTGSSATDQSLGAKVETTYASYISTSQPADTYTGKVKYVMVHPHDATAPEIPISIAEATTMQEVNSCPESIPLEQVYTLTDTRNNQTYKVARLKDGKCWMVENLHLYGGVLLSADDTDVTSDYINNFTTSNGLTKYENYLRLPSSSTSGFDTYNYSYVYNSANKANCGASGQNTPCYSYYSWDAATLGSGRNISTDSTDAPYSICPKGWRLPRSRGVSDPNWQTDSDFYALAHQYGLDSTTSTYQSYYEYDDSFYTKAGSGTITNFQLSGNYYYNNFAAGGSYGYYWSSTLGNYNDYGGSLIEALYFYPTHVDTNYPRTSNYGLSVRCLLKTD